MGEGSGELRESGPKTGGARTVGTFVFSWVKLKNPGPDDRRPENRGNSLRMETTPKSHRVFTDKRER